MVLTVFVVLSALVIGGVVRCVCHKYNALIRAAMFTAIFLTASLLVAVFEKVSFVPVFLIIR